MAAMPLRVVLVAVAAIAPSPSQAIASFEEYIAAYGRTYAAGSPEYAQRRVLFEKRLTQIEAQNLKPDRLWTASVNHLTDLTEEEFARLRGYRRVFGGDAGQGFGPTALLAERAERHGPPPASVDWRHLNTFAHVPNQGGCGSCWAVTAATVLQAHHEIHVDGNRSFSAQQLVNCVKNPHKCGGSGGCDGATVELAIDYAVQHGLHDSREVPYAGRDQVCAEEQSQLSGLHRHHHGEHQQLLGGETIGLHGYSKLPENRALPLLQALVDGPVGISVAASAWSLYGTGIFDGCDRNAEIDHAVVLIGYGKDNKQHYWNIQNSWGAGWGENGHIRLFRHGTVKEEEAFCGTDHDPKVGTACEPYPDAVEVCGMCGLLYDSVMPHFSAESSRKSHSRLKLRGHTHSTRL